MSVLQVWVQQLGLMQQAVLLAGIRGPDGIRKDHVAKLLLRWYRRCIVISAFTRRTMTTPWEDDGGSFTGPSVRVPELGDERGFVGDNQGDMTALVKEYLKTVDELPHHFQLHFMHGAEILGYKHPDLNIRAWWWDTYRRLVNDMHLEMESEERMDYRLGDREESWRACEAGVTASGPSLLDDGIDSFLVERCDRGAGLFAPVSELWQAYQKWTEANRILLVLARQSFAAALEERGIPIERRRCDGLRMIQVYRGLAIKGESASAPKQKKGGKGK